MGDSQIFGVAAPGSRSIFPGSINRIESFFPSRTDWRGTEFLLEDSVVSNTYSNIITERPDSAMSVGGTCKWLTWSFRRKSGGNTFVSGPNGKYIGTQPICWTYSRNGGAEPFGLLQAADGKLYGMSNMNGAPQNGQPTNGSFWVIDAGLPPPEPRVINFQPTSGAPGATFLLQGSHFVGTREVTIGGHSASFTVLTAKYIRVTVPSGATTGTISVTNAGGTTTTTKTFTVK